MTPQRFDAFADKPEHAEQSPAHTDPSSSTTQATTSVGGENPDPLRGSRTSGFWSAALALVVVLLMLAIFILQNTQKVEVSFLGWHGRSPLAATLLIAAVAGALLVATAGLLRILQLRRRVKRELRA